MGLSMQTKRFQRSGWMSDINTGGPAFPSSEWDAQYDRTFHAGGMTLRDYFAAQALTGAQIWDAVLNGENAQFCGGVDKLAEVAYSVADAMLSARGTVKARNI
jgi:hypothetical protein